MRAITVWTSSHRYYHTPRHRWIPLKPTPMSECELTAVFLCLNFGGNFVSSSESCRSIYYISRSKDSANRVKCQRKNLFSLNFRDAAYLSHIQKVAIYYKVIVFFYVSLLIYHLFNFFFPPWIYSPRLSFRWPRLWFWHFVLLLLSIQIYAENCHNLDWT